MIDLHYGWNVVKGSGHWKAEEEAIELKANGSDTLFVNGNSPEAADGELEFTLTPLNPTGKIGAVIRYVSPDSWVFIGCDTPMDPFGKSTWIWSLPSGEKGVLFKADPLYEGKAYRVKLRYVGSVLVVWMDGYQVYLGHIPQMKPEPGRTGFRAWASEDREQGEGFCRISAIKEKPVSDSNRYGFAAISEGEAPIAVADQQLIKSERLEVLVDSSFPRVVEYRWRETGALLYGQEKRLAYVDINGDLYEPDVSFKRFGNKAIYQLSFPEIQVEMKVTFEVNDSVLEMSITDIRESGEFQVITIEFPRHSLVSVRSVQEGAYAACAEGIKGDHFFFVSEQEETPVHVHYSIAILNTNELAASVLNNVLLNRRRVNVQTVHKDDYMETGIWNSYWTYRGPSGEVIDEPWSKVMITPDRNGDGIVDWQDGAIALRETRTSIPGADMLRNSYAHIVMNFASMAQYPFLRILDNVKKFYLYSDGFGQMIELKGYQSEGHDSGHPDYGSSFNARAGGLTDLNLLVDRALEYHAAIGVHINHSEAYPEAKAYSNSIITTTQGWRWLDQSYYIDREKDIMSGGFDLRLDELKEKVPNLSFIYVDTYRDEHWAAYRLAKKLHGNGWTIWTEEADMLDQHAVWTHDSTGDSMISRFIHHTEKDAYEVHPLLKGGYTRAIDNGFMGWQKERDITDAIGSFFTKQLPYRYLMHFPVKKWTDTEVILEGNVTSGLEDGENVIYRNGIKIASGDTVFIPWNPQEEVKIYHWNPAGGESTWTLPESWQGRLAEDESGNRKAVTTVKLYRLTDLGRVFVDDLPIAAGTVTVNAEALTPYVIYLAEAPPLIAMNWGEGSPVRDMGFDSHGFAYWRKSSTAADTDHITIRNTSYGQTYLHISGNGGADALVSQAMSGLEFGKTYSASVWVQVSAGRQAAICVTHYGGPDVIKEIDRTAVVNWDIDSDKRGTYYQRLRLIFTMPDSGDRSPVLCLKAGTGDEDSFVHFDDIRVREIDGSILQDRGNGHYFYEDFEHVDEGWGPFVSSNGRIGRTHLSQRHAGCTNDTIGGDWSMKTMDEKSGELFRTLPSTVQFEPNQKYRISFDYKADLDGQYSAVVRAGDGGMPAELMNTALNKGLHRFAAEFTAGHGQDHYFAIVKNDDSKGMLVLDHFTVDLC
ncbi:endo-alpha-N-acetylgalactosaminidase family protein [Paenibacillus sp. LHD-38]|uniref:endo-alpha-N-acetylgalactosaminidase family protein n=1 Tax=Paenibacillus sp. LHD-38 TaxID=3072143 RepID=UPI00280E88C2|nr:endo-alpha-N-acetylgalactosaminidase family protein [Paenibacillus sp. LHD-38]MDQ8738776.1 endo-alpha-N-acetylgalactosaminidase family protein [Paenibacillus sp. LHD-38]